MSKTLAVVCALLVLFASTTVGFAGGLSVALLSDEESVSVGFSADVPSPDAVTAGEEPAKLDGSDGFVVANAANAPQSEEEGLADNATDRNGTLADRVIPTGNQSTGNVGPAAENGTASDNETLPEKGTTEAPLSGTEDQPAVGVNGTVDNETQASDDGTGTADDESTSPDEESGTADEETGTADDESTSSDEESGTADEETGTVDSDSTSAESGSAESSDPDDSDVGTADSDDGSAVPTEPDDTEQSSESDDETESESEATDSSASEPESDSGDGPDNAIDDSSSDTSVPDASDEG
ncbi:hypothetical protein [Halobellus marinus]|uniref:hypothetical protein n=1 Tax=Halobellus sp. GCM10025813 TaxID=3252665 RepID=UPI00361A8029